MAEEQKSSAKDPQAKAPQASNIKDLKPWEIDANSYADPKQRAEAKKVVNEWLEKLQKDIHDLLTENGLDTFVISAIRPSSRTPVLLHKGHIYHVAKLSGIATNILKSQVLAQIDDAGLPEH